MDNHEKNIETFQILGKNIAKKNQQKFRIEKVMKRKGNKLCVKQKGYNNSFNSWTDKNDVE